MAGGVGRYRPQVLPLIPLIGRGSQEVKVTKAQELQVYENGKQLGCLGLNIYLVWDEAIKINKGRDIVAARIAKAKEGK